MPFFGQSSISRSHGSRSEKFDICTFCRPRKYGGPVYSSCKNTTESGGQSCYARLSKPPKVQSRKLPTTRRLQKRISKFSPSPLPNPTIYVLQFEAYPYNTVPAEILGVFSNLDKVTSAAISHGAYAFSREGLHDGSEYLTPSGRIRIFSEEFHQPIVKAKPPPKEEYIPHPDSQVEAARQEEARKTVFIAISQVSTNTSCLGLFGEKIKAWTACVKNQAMTVSSESLLEETRWSDEKGMPYIKGNIEGSGSHLWFVSAFEVDKVVR
jgi:hypothetical protein